MVTIIGTLFIIVSVGALALLGSITGINIANHLANRPDNVSAKDTNISTSGIVTLPPPSPVSGNVGTYQNNGGSWINGVPGGYGHQTVNGAVLTSSSIAQSMGFDFDVDNITTFIVEKEIFNTLDEPQTIPDVPVTLLQVHKIKFLKTSVHVNPKTYTCQIAVVVDEDDFELISSLLPSSSTPMQSSPSTPPPPPNSQFKGVRLIEADN